MYWNASCLHTYKNDTSWIVTLDVLKCEKKTGDLDYTCWIVTLDVLKCDIVSYGNRLL